MGINPFLTFLVCVPTRTLMGWLSGVIFQAVKKVDKTRTVAILNTIFFMGMLILCFWNAEGFQAFVQANVGTGLSIGGFLIAMVGVNGAVEAPVACVAGGAISKAVSKAMKM